MPDVFISYNREDRETAGLVANALVAEGFTVWWDAALRAGETYDEVTEQNLRSAGAVVVLWSKRSANSKWVRAEATVGERSSTLVPALIEDCERPIRFELVQTADLRHWRGDRADTHWRAFMQDVRTAVQRRTSEPLPDKKPTGSSQDVTIETSFWDSIKNGTDPSDFEAYLKRYPNGFFASIAQRRLSALTQPSPPPRVEATPVQSRAAVTPSAPSRAAPPSQLPSEPQTANRKSVSGLIAGLAILFLIVAGAVAFYVTQGAPDADQTITAELSPPADPPRAPDGVANVVTNAPVVGAAEELIDVGATGGEFAVGADVNDMNSGDDELSPAEPSVENRAAAAEAPTPVAAPTKPVAGNTFRDCDSCPLMVTLPGGVFTMGSPSSEAGHNAYEGPQRDVTLKPFAIGVYELTNSEWQACVANGACKERPSSGGDAFPALYLSWRDAGAYAAWLSKETGRKYRLPSEAEWEYAARAGTTTPYWWGEKFERAKVGNKEATAVGSFAANAFGIHDVAGNAREWVADCYVNNFSSAPTDGSAVRDGDCGRRVIRGGSWESPPADTRVANRSRIGVDVAARYMGVRLAADLE